jgi:cytochrome oxidase assembly protein ShyY1
MLCYDEVRTGFLKKNKNHAFTSLDTTLSNPYLVYAENWVGLSTESIILVWVHRASDQTGSDREILKIC